MDFDRGTAAFPIIQIAFMDLNRVSNIDLISANHSSIETEDTRVAQREERARARAKLNGTALDYSLGNDFAYKKWLLKNRKWPQ